MKACVPLVLCVAIFFSTPSLAETKQSQPPSSIQPGTTIQTLNKMCQENANSRPYTACVAYLRGLFDGMQQAKIVEDLKKHLLPARNCRDGSTAAYYRGMGPRQSKESQCVCRLGRAGCSVSRISMS